jgi:CBS domain containing-hemolysin-like protein
MIRGVLDIGDLTVREVMVPRMDVVALDADAPLSEAADLVADRGFSRIPVYEGDLDRVVGILYAKELLRAFQTSNVSTIRSLLRPVSFVPDSKPVAELLRDFRQSRVHLAIVVDEYGGTAGLVTIEDVLEEIVGEIHDEFEAGRPEPQSERQPDGTYVVDGRTTLNDLSDLVDTDLEEEEVLTVGGLLADRLGRIPEVGDEVEVDSLRLTVLSVSGHRPERVRVTPNNREPEESAK